MELNIVNIATICSIISTVITIFSYIKSTRTFYRLILILITLSLISISLILYSESKWNEKKEKNIISKLNYQPLDKDLFLSYGDSLNRDSTDLEFLRKNEVVSGIYSTSDKATELNLLIDYSLLKSKYFWAIKYADEIYSTADETKNYEKIIKSALQDKSNFKYAIIAANEIYSTSNQETQLRIIIDSCLFHKKFEEAYIAAELIYSTATRDEYKSKILRKMNNTL